MPHADWLIISGPEKVILPARENIVQIKFLCKLNLIYMPHHDDEDHSPIEFYCSRKTHDPKCWVLKWK